MPETGAAELTAKIINFTDPGERDGDVIMTRRVQGKLCELAALLGQEPEDRQAVDAVLAELRAMARASAALQRVGRQLQEMAQLPIPDRTTDGDR